jgi:hypothetical protein
MRLGKRERAAKKALAKLRLAVRVKANAPEPVGKYASAWNRFFPVLRPVYTPKAMLATRAWEYNGRTAAVTHRKGIRTK